MPWPCNKVSGVVNRAITVPHRNIELHAAEHACAREEVDGAQVAEDAEAPAFALHPHTGIYLKVCKKKQRKANK